MQAAQEDVGADGALVEDLQQVLRVGFQNDLVQDLLERRVLGEGLPALAILADLGFAGNDRGQRLPPGSGGDARVGGGQVDPGLLQVERRLAGGLIPGHE